MAAKKYRRLTNKEKQFNKEFRQQMINEGIRQPPKAKLNRKKYIEETEALWENRDRDTAHYMYFVLAVSYMLGHRDRNWKVSPEAIGAAKVLRLILRLEEFDRKLELEGRTTYKVDEQIEFIMDIIKA